MSASDCTSDFVFLLLRFHGKSAGGHVSRSGTAHEAYAEAFVAGGVVLSPSLSHTRKPRLAVFLAILGLSLFGVSDMCRLWF